MGSGSGRDLQHLAKTREFSPSFTVCEGGQSLGILETPQNVGVWFQPYTTICILLTLTG